MPFFHDYYVYVCNVVTVECSELLPEGGRDRLAKLFYYPVFAEGERRASLGNLGMDEAAAGHDRHHAPEHAQGQFTHQLSVGNTGSVSIQHKYVNVNRPHSAYTSLMTAQFTMHHIGISGCHTQ